ncbi:MAG: hypothetical protein Q9207_005303 [Kuettlingeria erythrocarpa]
MEHSHQCNHCLRVFDVLEELHKHREAKVHCFCSTNDGLFLKRKRLAQQIRLAVPVTQFRCIECDRDFIAGGALVHRPQIERYEYHTPPAPTVMETNCTEDAPPTHRLSGRDSYLKELERHFAGPSLDPINDRNTMTTPKMATLSPAPSQDLENVARCSGSDRAQDSKLVHEHHIGSLIECDTLVTQRTSLIDVAINAENSPAKSDCSKPSSYHTAMDSGRGSSMEPALAEEVSACFSPFSSAQVSPAEPADDVSASNRSRFIPPKSTRFFCPQCPPFSSNSFSTIKALHEHLASHARESEIYSYPSDLPMSGITGRSGKDRQEVLSENFLATIKALKHNMDASESGEKPEGAVEFVENQLEELGFEGLKLME